MFTRPRAARARHDAHRRGVRRQHTRRRPRVERKTRETWAMQMSASSTRVDPRGVTLATIGAWWSTRARLLPAQCTDPAVSAMGRSERGERWIEGVSEIFCYAYFCGDQSGSAKRRRDRPPSWSVYKETDGCRRHDQCRCGGGRRGRRRCGGVAGAG
jgi:hypothetical protein